MSMKRILILPRYTKKGPSSRVRMVQYLPYLNQVDFDHDVHPFFDDSYIDSLYRQKPRNFLKILKAYFDRITVSLKSQRYDLIWLQYELLPWMPFCLEKLLLRNHTKLVVDYDDAVFHRYDKHPSVVVRKLLGKKIDRLMRSASVVIAGNEYLADRANCAGARRVEIIPSVVDISRYPLKTSWEGEDGVIRIGWIGSPNTVKYLLEIKDVIQQITGAASKFIIIGAEVPRELKRYSIEVRKWSLDKEAELLQDLDIGIMPLIDAPFERGKCGYKLIQYMACGLPVVASPVGVNKKLVQHEENGFLAESDKEWVIAIDRLKHNPRLRKEMGLKGRKLVAENFCVQKSFPKIIRLFIQV